MFIEAAILGIIIGFLRGGKLNRLARINLRWWPLAMIALLIQVGLWAGFERGYLQDLTPYLHLFSYVPLLIFVYVNRKFPGMYLIGLGLLLNLLAIATNGGVMPVDPSKLAPRSHENLLSGTSSPLHAPISETTRFPFLGDIFRLPYGDHRLISWGDLFLSLGLFHLIQQGMQKTKTARKKRSRRKITF